MAGQRERGGAGLSDQGQRDPAPHPPTQRVCLSVCPSPLTLVRALADAERRLKMHESGLLQSFRERKEWGEEGTDCGVEGKGRRGTAGSSKRKAQQTVVHGFPCTFTARPQQQCAASPRPCRPPRQHPRPRQQHQARARACRGQRPGRWWTSPRRGRTGSPGG